MAVEPLASSVANTLGARIVAGDLGLGDVIRLDDIDEEFGVSRSVSREAVKILESHNFVRSRRRVGVLILAPHEWDLMAPRVIGWHLAGPHRLEEMRWLSQLRGAIEPMAARLAAGQAHRDHIGAVVEAASAMDEVARARDFDRLLRADIEFHTGVLVASGNPLFAAQARVVGAVLEGRARHLPYDPRPEAIELHGEVARCVAVGDGAGAEQAMRAIVDEARQAVETDSAKG